MHGIDLIIIHSSGAAGIFGPDLAQSLVAIEQPMWARLLAGYVRDRGYTVNIIDAEALNLNAWQVASLVEAAKPRLVCLAVYGHMPSASTQQMESAGLAARAIKKQCDVPIIMVGGHPSALPVRTLKEEAVDYVCVGEGPETLVGLLDNAALEDIPGLVWRLLGGIKINPRALLIEDLSELHGNTWDLLPMDAYRSHNWQAMTPGTERQPYASIYTSLGCSFGCSFCCINAPFGGRRYRLRDPDDVVAEILMLYETYDIRTFKITDEMFVLNPAHYTTIAQGLVDADIGQDINIWTYTRPDTVREGNLDLLRAAGIRWLALGIESGSKRVRAAARKDFKNTDIKHIVRTIQDHDISVIGNYIFGLPDDDMESMQETLDLALDLNCEFANFYCLPPGTPVYTPTGMKAIDALKSGDEVLSESGVASVVTPMSRPYSGKLYKIKPRYLPAVSVTDEHPVKVASIKRDRTNEVVIGPPRWEKPSELRPYVDHWSEFDAVIVPTPPSRETFVDFSPYVLGHVGGGQIGGQLSESGKRFLVPWAMTMEMAELFGWYVAEGSLFSRTNNQLGFSLGANEPENVERVKALVDRCFGYKTQVVERESVVRIGFVSKVMLRCFPELMGNECYNKKIPDCVMLAGADIAAAFLLGYVAGDGTSHPNENGQYSLSTASNLLAHQLVQLFLKIGILPGWHETPPNDSGGIRSGKNYKLSWTTTPATHYFKDKKAFYVPIKRIDVEKFDGTVYNVETSDNTYSTPFVVHNCAMAYPGSPLYDEAVAKGWTLPDTWAGYSQHNAKTRPLDTEYLTAAQVLRFRDAAFLTYFQNPKYMQMVADKFGDEAVRDIENMTRHRLPRDLLTEASPKPAPGFHMVAARI